MTFLENLLYGSHGYHCNELNSVYGIVFGVIIIISIILSYIPQYRKIIKNKTSEGISNYYILLYNITNFTNFYGTLLINFNIVNCCLDVSLGNCFNLLTPIYQIFTPFLATFILYIIFLIYEPNTNKIINKTFIEFILFISIFIVLFGIVGMVFLLKYSEYQENVLVFGNSLNIISMITCVVCLLPQIHKVYKEKSIGTLSTVSLGFQVPGSLIVFIYQFAIIKAPISVGLPYLISFLLQSVLLVQCIYYERQQKKLNNYQLIVNYETND